MNARNAVIAGFALFVAVLASTAIAAPGPVEVRVVNPNSAPVPVSVVGGSATAVKARGGGNVTSPGIAYEGYKNTGSQSVILTALQAQALADSSCGAMTVSYAIVHLDDGQTNFNVRFGPGLPSSSSGCVWFADLPGGIVVGPGKRLLVSIGWFGGSGAISGPINISLTASGHTLP